MQRHDHSPGMGLDEADRKRLAAALAGAREAGVYRRLEALLLVAEGHSVAEAARRSKRPVFWLASITTKVAFGANPWNRREPATEAASAMTKGLPDKIC